MLEVSLCKVESSVQNQEKKQKLGSRLLQSAISREKLTQDARDIQQNRQILEIIWI